jgi:hypothetical protein
MIVIEIEVRGRLAANVVERDDWSDKQSRVSVIVLYKKESFTGVSNRLFCVVVRII